MIFNKMILLVTCSLLSVGALAQQTTTSDQQIVYKWYENGIAHYAKTPPRGNDDYIRINQYGMVVKERPNTDSFQVIKPIRPTATQPDNNQSTVSQQNESEEMPDGTISKDERCEMMQQQLTALETKEEIYQEDESGNLLPLDNKEVEQHKQELKDDLARICEN